MLFRLSTTLFCYVTLSTENYISLIMPKKGYKISGSMPTCIGCESWGACHLCTKIHQFYHPWKHVANRQWPATICRELVFDNGTVYGPSHHEIWRGQVCSWGRVQFSRQRRVRTCLQAQWKVISAQFMLAAWISMVLPVLYLSMQPT